MQQHNQAEEQKQKEQVAEAKRNKKRNKKEVKFGKIYEKEDPYGHPKVLVGVVEERRSTRSDSLTDEDKSRKKKKN